jgi:hypothetical protein
MIPIAAPFARVFRTPRDVVEILSEQVDLITHDTTLDAPERARIVGGLCAIGLRALEQAEGDERLRAVEQVLKLRLEPKRS